MTKTYLYHRLIGKSFGNDCKVIEHAYTTILKNGKPRQYFKVKCHCNAEWILPSTHMCRVRECWNCAHKNRGLKIRGKNHPNYNPDLTDEQRFTNRRHSVNRENYKHIYQRDNFTCQKCLAKSKKLVAHHLDGWADFPEKRQDPYNLVTLCNKCHVEFHKKFGYGNNTREQFQQFKT